MKLPDNIREVSNLPIDYIGHIFYEKSPRNVSGEIELTSRERVGVFVNESQAKILELSERHQFTHLQLHGDESPEFCRGLKSMGKTIIKAFRVDDDFDFSTTKPYQSTCDFFLFDAKGKDYGGNGITFNWDVLNRYQGDKKFFLSGGISLATLPALLRYEHPGLFALDINSKFEISPGLKNIKTLETFVNSIRNEVI